MRQFEFREIGLRVKNIGKYIKSYKIQWITGQKTNFSFMCAYIMREENIYRYINKEAAIKE
jgi:hypothetical protein